MKIISNKTGTQALIGYRVEISEGSARVVLDIDHRHINRGNSLHGGIMATLLDAAAGYTASLSVDGETLIYTSTVSMTVNYLARVADGRVVATGRKTGGGKNIVFVDAQLTDNAGKLIATATCTFKLFTESGKSHT